MYRLVFLTLCLALFAACGDDSASNTNSATADSSDEFYNSSSSQNGGNGNNIDKPNGGNGSGESSPDSNGNVDIVIPGDSAVGPVIGDEPVVEDSTLVSDISKMPDCTVANEGEAMMVSSENTVYFCSGGEWVSNVVETIGVSCSNGTLFAGAELPTVSPSTFGIDSTGTLVLRREGVMLSGLAEKGPFRFGASVKVTELDSVMRLEPSDRSHSTCISSADGAYNFESVDLASPYVTVEASGYYRSELTGGMSADMVTLKAVTDLTERDSVNVNILTHLEAPRTLKLVENTGNNRPIRDMKAQALKDILYSFGFLIEGFNESSFVQQPQGQNNGGWGMTPSTVPAGPEKYSDDIRLFGDGDFSAALLALSVMMQRHGSGEAMVAYADGIADRIRGNGNWDDWAARADLADWLMTLDLRGDFEKIRKNVASWKLGEVPDFEKYLRKFWTREFQFPECTLSNDGQVVHIGYSQSAFFGCNYQDTSKTKVRFTCDANLGRWRAATDIEKDTVGLSLDTAKYDGAFRGGVINPEISYIYNEAANTWRVATSADVMDFTDIKDVYATLGAGEKVVFVLRHAERGADASKNAHLTDNGKNQARSVGAMFAGAGEFGLGYSGYTRTLETCEYIAAGNKQSNVNPELIEGLDGDYYISYMKAYEGYKSGSSSLHIYTRYIYRDMYSDAFYDLEERSLEFLNTYILSKKASLQKVNFYISHDMMVVPLTAFASQKKINLRYFDNRNWLNYLAGVAVIIGVDGSVRYVPVRGLETGYQII